MKKFAILLAVVASLALAPAPTAQASTCFQDYENTVIDPNCGWACRMDAAVDLAACVYHQF